MTRRGPRLLAVALLAGVAGCAARGPTAPPLDREVAEEVLLEATVRDVDHYRRFLTIADDAGEVAVFHADAEVPGFAWLQIGDRVRGRLVESVVLAMRTPTPEEAAASGNVLAVGARTEPGRVLNLSSFDRVAVGTEVVAIYTEAIRLEGQPPSAPP